MYLRPRASQLLHTIYCDSELLAKYIYTDQITGYNCQIPCITVPKMAISPQYWYLNHACRITVELSLKKLLQIPNMASLTLSNCDCDIADKWVLLLLMVLLAFSNVAVFHCEWILLRSLSFVRECRRVISKLGLVHKQRLR